MSQHPARAARRTASFSFRGVRVRRAKAGIDSTPTHRLAALVSGCSCFHIQSWLSDDQQRGLFMANAHTIAIRITPSTQYTRFSTAAAQKKGASSMAVAPCSRGVQGLPALGAKAAIFTFPTACSLIIVQLRIHSRALNCASSHAGFGPRSYPAAARSPRVETAIGMASSLSAPMPDSTQVVLPS